MPRTLHILHKSYLRNTSDILRMQSHQIALLQLCNQDIRFSYNILIEINVNNLADKNKQVFQNHDSCKKIDGFMTKAALAASFMNGKSKFFIRIHCVIITYQYHSNYV